jgi:hypothetical protein
MKHPLSCSFLNAARLSAVVSIGRSPLSFVGAA